MRGRGTRSRCCSARNPELQEAKACLPCLWESHEVAWSRVLPWAHFRGSGVRLCLQQDAGHHGTGASPAGGPGRWTTCHRLGRVPPGAGADVQLSGSWAQAWRGSHRAPLFLPACEPADSEVALWADALCPGRHGETAPPCPASVTTHRQAGAGAGTDSHAVRPLSQRQWQERPSAQGPPSERTHGLLCEIARRRALRGVWLMSFPFSPLLAYSPLFLHPHYGPRSPPPCPLPRLPVPPLPRVSLEPA